MPAGDEVGRAFIEILPELDRFIRQLRRDLRAILAKAEQNTQGSTDRMGQDFDNLGHKVRDTFEGVNNDVRNSVEHNRDTVVKELGDAGEVGGRHLRGNLEQNLRQISNDVKKIRAPIVGEFQVMGQQMGDRLSIEFRRHLKQIQADTRRTALRAGKSWDLYVVEARKAFAQFEKDQAAAGFRSIKRVFTDMNKFSKRKSERVGNVITRGIGRGIFRGRQQVLHSFAKVLDLFVTGPEINLFLRRLGSNIIFLLVGLAAAAAQAVTQALVPLSVALMQSLAILPGLLSAGVAGLAVFKAATLGMGDALKFANVDVDKFNEALKKLAPSARGYAIAVRDLRKALTPLQQAIQNAFFAGTGTQIALIGRSIAQLKVPIVALAGAFNGIFFDVLRFARSLQALDAGRKIISGLRDFLVALRPAIIPLLNMFASLTGQAGKFGGVVGKALADLIIKFSAFASKIDLAEVFDNLKTAISLLMPAFGFLKVVFLALNDIATAFRPALTALGPAFLTFAQILAEVAEGVGPGFGAFIRALGDGLKGLAPAAKPFGEAIGALAKAAAPLLKALGPLLGDALVVLSTALTGIVTAAAPLIEVFAELVAQGATALLPVLIKLAADVLPQVAEAATEIFNALAPIIPIAARFGQEFLTKLIPPLTQFVDQTLAALLPALVEAAQILGPVLVDALIQLEPYIPELVEATLALVKAFITFNTGIGPLLPLLIRSIAVAIQVAVFSIIVAIEAWRAFKAAMIAVISGPIRLGRAAFNLLRAAGKGLGVAISVAGGVIKGALRSAGGVITSFGGKFRSMYNAARSALNSVVSAVRSAKSRITGALSNAGSILYNAGRRIIQGLINGIKSMIGALGNAIASAAAKIRNALPFSPAKEGPLSGSGDPRIAGAKIAQMIATGIRSQVGTIRSAIGDAAGAAVPGVGTGLAFAGAGAGAATSVSSGVDEVLLARLLARELTKALNGVEFHMTGVDRVVARAVGKSTNRISRGG